MSKQTRTAHLQTLPKQLNLLENYMDVEVPDTPVYNYVRIQSLIPAHLHYEGKVSKTSYEWPKAGDVVQVRVEDAEELLAKRYSTASCCGNNGEGKLFKLVNEV
jgi:hypothetical protein